MDKIVQLHKKFYEGIKNDLAVKEMLKQEEITVLDGFENNIELVQRYYQTFYPTQ